MTKRIPKIAIRSFQENFEVLAPTTEKPKKFLITFLTISIKNIYILGLKIDYKCSPELFKK